MAFRANSIIPERAFAEAKGVAAATKLLAQKFITRFASGAEWKEVYELLQILINRRAKFDELKTTPGIATYAQQQENDNTYDVVAEFTALLANITNVIDAIVSSAPKDVNDFQSNLKLML